MMEIRPYIPGDETAILELFKQSFGKEMNPEFWKWRFKQNPFCENEMISLMWDGDTLAGHYAVSPAEMIMDGKPQLTALSMTTMTHPGYAGRGIFTQLANHLYEEIHQTYQVKMVWGFPNLNSHYGFMKNLGWEDIAVVHCMRLEPAAFKVNKDAAFTQITDSALFPGYTSGTAARIRLNKTRAYYNWRYFRNPVNRYIVLSLTANPSCFIIFKTFENNGSTEIDIMEMQHDHTVDVIHNLLSAAAIFVQEERPGTSVFNYWSSLFQPEHLLLEKLRFVPSLPLTFLGARVFDNTLKYPYDFRSWEIAMDYSDVF